MSGSSSVAVFSLALLSTCAALDSASKKVQAYMGETVVLPCSITDRNDIPTVEWSRTGPPSEIAFVYRHGCETFEMKSPVFQFRTNLFMSQVNNGNLSLRISQLRLSDQGEYQCKIIEPGAKPKVIETVKLLVGAASEPRLSDVSGKGDRMVLQCESNCWFPAPDITFLDDQGKDLPAHKPMRDQDSQRCFNVKRNVTLQTDTKRVTCRVQQPQIHQTRDAEINIPAKFTCSSFPNWILIVVAVVVCVISCGVTFILHKKCSSCVCVKKQSESKKSSVDHGTSPQSTEGCTSNNQLDNTEHVTAEQQNRRSTSPPGSSADISLPTNPPHNNQGASDRNVSGQNPACPVRGHHGNDSSSSLLDNNGAASSDVSSAPTSGEQIPFQLRRLSESSRNRAASFRLSRSNTMSRHSTCREDTEPLVEIEPGPENEG